MTSKFIETRFCTLIKWHVIFPLIAFRISFIFVLNHEQRSLHELNEVNLSLCKLIGKAMESHDLQKDFIKDISLCTIWKCVLKFWILLILEEERFLILKEQLLLKNNPLDFFLFEYAHFENQQWLEIMLIKHWMNGWTPKF